MADHVVVYHQGALGDFLLSMAVLQGLAQAHPSMRIIFRTRSEHARLISGLSYYAGFNPGDAADLAPFFQSRGWDTAALPEDFHNARAVLIFGQPSTIPFAEHLSQRLHYPVHWVQSFPREDVEEHVTRFIAARLKACDWTTEDVLLRLEPLPRAVEVVESLLAEKSVCSDASILVVHMGSGGRRKIWPIQGWRLLLTRLARERPEKLVTVLGPADDVVRGFALEMAGDLGLTVVEGLRLTELAALLSRASVYVGNDSGVTHLAAAMGAPTVALFGPTRPEVWAPLGENVRVVRLSWPEGRGFDEPGLTVAPSDVERVRRQLLALLG